MKQKELKTKIKYCPPSWIKEALKTLKPPERISVSEYADKNRILGSENAEPGKWNTSRTPYLEDIMNTYNDPDIEEVGFVKPTQVKKPLQIWLFYRQQTLRTILQTKEFNR